jgi:hypothetical protein
MRGAHRSRLAGAVFAAALAGTAPAPPAQAVDLDPGLLVRVESAYGSQQHALQKLELRIEPAIDLRFESGWKLAARGRLRADARDELDVTAEGRIARGALNRPWRLADGIELELRELYVDGNIGVAAVRLGKQQVVWGQADGLRVLDVVNPFSFREFVLPEPADRRIPLWTVNVEWPLGDGTLQALWIPDASYDEIPLRRQPFAVTSPLWVPPASTLQVLPTAQRPTGLAARSEWGLRWQRQAGRWDLTLNALDHHHDTPTPFRERVAGASVIRPRHERTQLLGGSVAVAIGRSALRAELGYSTRRWFLSADPDDDDGVFASPELAYVIGLDYTGIEHTLLSAQVFQSHLARHPAGASRRRRESQATLLAQRDFAQDTWRVRLLMLGSLDRGDGAAQFQVSWRVRSATRLSLGVDAFFGDPQGLFGEFRQASRAIAAVEIGF